MAAAMKLTDYLAGMASAMTAAELEAAIQAPFANPFLGPAWSRISKAIVEAGARICAAHENGRFVPTFGPRRQLAVCGEVFKVGRGGNSTGVRYAWHYAKEWAVAVIVRNGLTQRAAHGVWDWWSEYPHRCLPIIADALAGKMPDPEMGKLIRHDPTPGGRPINYSVERNNADVHDHRANQPCACGGTLFDWGAGHSAGFDFINWHCNACPDVFTEYVTKDRLYEIRHAKPPALSNHNTGG